MEEINPIFELLTTMRELKEKTKENYSLKDELRKVTEERDYYKRKASELEEGFSKRQKIDVVCAEPIAQIPSETTQQSSTPKPERKKYSCVSGMSLWKKENLQTIAAALSSSDERKNLFKIASEEWKKLPKEIRDVRFIYYINNAFIAIFNQSKRI
jgi:uncharacterized protein YhaN